MEKLYIIVRADLRPGLQIAQACHAQHAFCERHQELKKAWKGNLVVLQTPDEDTLDELHLQIIDKGFAEAMFAEIDLDNEKTAIAVEGAASRLLSTLPLALRLRTGTLVSDRKSS